MNFRNCRFGLFVAVMFVVNFSLLGVEKAQAIDYPFYSHLIPANNFSANSFAGTIDCYNDFPITRVSFSYFTNFTDTAIFTLDGETATVDIIPQTPAITTEMVFNFSPAVECVGTSLPWNLTYTSGATRGGPYDGIIGRYQNDVYRDISIKFIRISSGATVHSVPFIQTGRIWYDVGDIAVIESSMGTSTNGITEVEQAELLLLLLIWATIVTVFMCYGLVSTYKKRKYLQYGGGDVEVREDL